MNSTEWAATAALGTWASVLIYGALLFYASRQVNEAARLRRAQMRPFVVVDIPMDWLFKISIENIGVTVARDVTFEFPVPLASTMPRPWEFEESTLLRDGIKVLPPRKRYSFFFDSVHQRLAEGVDLPLVYDVIVRYCDEDCYKYDDTYTLDMKSYLGAEFPAKGLPDIVKEVSDIRNEIKKWSDGGRGLLVHARDKDEMEKKQRAALDERQAARAAGESS